MTSTAAIEHPVIAWGWAGQALEVESGDLHVVAPFEGGALVALIDGLGHGPEAASAALAAAAVLGAHAGEPVGVLVQRCHDALRKTRGAVLSVASFRACDSSVTWLGVGNVDAIVVDGRGNRRAAICSRGGVVGYQLPALCSATVEVYSGDVLVMVTDGIHSGFLAGLACDGSPQAIAESILDRFAKGSDDAHVVVARYLGAPS
jgi:hypothetical protein